VAPPTAQHGIRQARVAARNVAASLQGDPPEPYRYASRTAFVNLGRYKAVGRVGRLTFSGFIAWWMARTYHLSQIPGLVRKIRAVIDWTVSLPFQRDVSEVGSIGHPRPLREEEYAGGGSHRPLRD
jgi:NADH dehydrogenase